MWTTLNVEGEIFTVPPRAEGLMRLQWTAKKVGDQRYWARLWFDDEGTRTYQRVEAIVKVVEPVFLCAEDDPRWADVNVGRLKAGEKRTAQFLCWSKTRQHFTVAAAPSPADRCFTYGEPQPLTGAELKSLSEKEGANLQVGFRLTVAASERVGGAQLDVGPFRRQVNWRTDIAPGHELHGTVSGSVLGEVKLVDAPGKEYVDLGKVAPNDPAPMTFALESNDPSIQLSLDEKSTLHFLAAELLDGKEGRPIQGGRSWRVRVQYRKDSDFRGPFPQRERPGYDSDVACSVVFHLARQGTPGELNSQPFRRLFVPVHGVVLRGY
jgi:hypothetical protein